MFLRSGSLNYEEFLQVMGEKNRETDIEIHYKDTFRAFSKDDDGEIMISTARETHKWLEHNHNHSLL